MVVEDEVKMAALLRRGLSEEGLTVDIAGEGERAVAMAKAILVFMGRLTAETSDNGDCTARNGPRRGGQPPARQIPSGSTSIAQRTMPRCALKTCTCPRCVTTSS